MTVIKLKDLLKKHEKEHQKFIKVANKARLYYANKNDILRKKSPSNRRPLENDEDISLRKADNRVSNNFHEILVDQKASYAVAQPPQFDVGDDKKLNDEISDFLGDKFESIATSLVVDASNTSIAWLHVWEKEDEFKYAKIDPVQIIPIYSDDLVKELVAIIRVYKDSDDTTVYQHWDSDQVHTFAEDGSGNIVPLPDETYNHEWGKVPFIPFRNNHKESDDLASYKGHVDTYDKIYNGFINDLEDIQEVIMVLKGYVGTTLEEFQDALRDKHFVLDDDGQGSNSGIDTLTIEIPVEARDKMLEITRKRIFEAGKGLDPQDDRIGAASGIAMNFKYSLLEKKTKLLETEFRFGFAELIRFILIYLKKDPEIYKNIQQKWRRTKINNDLETAQALSMLAPITSTESIAKANIFVEDWEHELKLLKQAESNRNELANREFNFGELDE